MIVHVPKRQYFQNGRRSFKTTSSYPTQRKNIRNYYTTGNDVFLFFNFSISSLTTTEENLQAKVANSKERYETISKKINDSIAKLIAIRTQLTTITNRITELKKISQASKDNNQIAEPSSNVQNTTQDIITTD